MNRGKVILQDITFKELIKLKKRPAIMVKNKKEEMEGNMTLDEIIKISKDKKNIKSDRKRKLLTKQLFLDYLDINYNDDDY